MGWWCCWVSNRSVWLLELLTELTKENNEVILLSENRENLFLSLQTRMEVCYEPNVIVVKNSFCCLACSGLFEKVASLFQEKKNGDFVSQCLHPHFVHHHD